MIPKPTATSHTPTATLFLAWNPEEKANVMNRLHALADEHLDPSKSFTSQDHLVLRKVIKLINVEFPMLKDYEQNWAATHILQAHLKVTAAAATKGSSCRVVQAVASVVNGPGAPATARRRCSYSFIHIPNAMLSNREYLCCILLLEHIVVCSPFIATGIRGNLMMG
ncbi:hypothetical protein B0H10DRAFT_1944038 [Mycena sp. CBHHK59/15]|nr:hypothetical protein B0H10DRAFT_1944038 [Mycena sp. CBHHK59/15]